MISSRTEELPVNLKTLSHDAGLNNRSITDALRLPVWTFEPRTKWRWCADLGWFNIICFAQKGIYFWPFIFIGVILLPFPILDSIHFISKGAKFSLYVEVFATARIQEVSVLAVGLWPISRTITWKNVLKRIISLVI